MCRSDVEISRGEGEEVGLNLFSLKGAEGSGGRLVEGFAAREGRAERRHRFDVWAFGKDGAQAEGARAARDGFVQTHSGKRRQAKPLGRTRKRAQAVQRGEGEEVGLEAGQVDFRFAPRRANRA